MGGRSARLRPRRWEHHVTFGPDVSPAYKALWMNPMFKPNYLPGMAHCEPLVQIARSVAGLNYRIKRTWEYAERAYLLGSYMIGYSTSNRHPNECYVFTIYNHVSAEDGRDFIRNIPEDEKVTMIITGNSFTPEWVKAVRDSRSGTTEFLINNDIPWFKPYNSPTP